MLDRRRFAFGCAAALLALPRPSAADAPPLEAVGAAFRAMPASARRRAQTNLIASDLYLGPQDGLWGPGTAEGFRRLMTLEDYRQFARDLPADPAAAARATVMWATPDVLFD